MNEINMPVLIARFKQKMANGDKRLSTLKYLRLLLTLILVGTLMGFVYAFYLKAIYMYAPARFQQPLKEHSGLLGPKIKTAVVRIADETYPTFKTLIFERQKEIQPKLDEAVQVQTDLFLKTLHDEADKELFNTFKELAGKASKSFESSTPKFTDVDARAKFLAKVDQELDNDAKELHEELMSRYTRDMSKVQKSLERFRPSIYDNMEPSRRGWHYVHLWLQVADFEMLRRATEAAASTRAPDAAKPKPPIPSPTPAPENKPTPKPAKEGN